MVTEAKKIKLVKQQILEKISPSKEEEAKLKKFLRELLTVSKLKSGKDAVVCGSIGKGDWHAGNHDIDLFILFPKSTKRDVLEDDGLLYGKQIAAEMKGEAVMKFAEHPYIKAVIQDYDVDIVPAYRIKVGEKIISAVDRSPLHLQYILKKFNDKLRDETRLLKQFMRGIGVYGSDVKTEGFSGYACELLVLNYGSFEKVLKAAVKWNPIQVLQLKGKPNKKRLLKKFPEPLIIIDPVDKNRNVTSIVSPERMIYFIKKSKNFLEQPDANYFEEAEPVTMDNEQMKTVKLRKTKFFSLQIERNRDIVDDTLYPQLRRAMRRIASVLKDNEFIVMNTLLSEETEGRIYMIFEMEVWELPAIKKMMGPFIEAKKNVKDFLAKYPPEKGFVPYIEGKIWHVDKIRENRDAVEAVRDFLTQDIEELNKQGIPKKIAESMFQARLLEHDDFWTILKENKTLSDLVRRKFFESMA
ncbi:CCA tRNA nucleotidyltransferase [archaeon]|nr:CCA tRNA nucleotidyltransferase [archaeon]